MLGKKDKFAGFIGRIDDYSSSFSLSYILIIALIIISFILDTIIIRLFKKKLLCIFTIILYFELFMAPIIIAQPKKNFEKNFEDLIFYYILG